MCGLLESPGDLNHLSRAFLIAHTQSHRSKPLVTRKPPNPQIHSSTTSRGFRRCRAAQVLLLRVFQGKVRHETGLFVPAEKAEMVVDSGWHAGDDVSRAPGDWTGAVEYYLLAKNWFRSCRNQDYEEGIPLEEHRRSLA